MTEEVKYRSSIDELVLKSGFSGLKIAREMGITANRMVALRRARDKNVSTDDLAACGAAVNRLGGDTGFDSDEQFAVIPEVCPHCEFVKSINEKFDEHAAVIQSLLDKLGN